MTSDTTLLDHLQEWMRRRGWREVSRGAAGVLWSDASGRSIAIPESLASDLHAFEGVVRRLADASDTDDDKLARKLRNWSTDVTYIRAANDFVIADTIPLHAGAVLLSSTRTMFRAAATSAVRRRANIGNSYSKLGNEIANGIRMDQTQSGSYAIPILVQVGEKTRYESKDEKQSDLFAGDDVETIDEIESAERRMSRTFAEALTAVDDLIITPKRSPRTDEIVEMVNRGVTREFVASLSKVLEETAVASIDATFEWAETQGVPNNIKESVSVPSAASVVLNETAEKLKSTSLPSGEEVFVGPIVMVAQEPQERTVHFAIRTNRHRRPCRIESMTETNSLDQVTGWMRNQTSLTLAGKVRRIRGVLRIEQPTTLVSAELSYENPARSGLRAQVEVVDPNYVDPKNPPGLA